MAAKRSTTKATVIPDTSWFQHDRFGMFIHWGLYALAARHEWVKHRERIDTATYQKYFKHFDPDLYDPREWARLARRAGMKYFVITTKHHEGFCLWDTQYTDYKATNTPYGKDLLTPMVDAFREEGLRVGFYHSLIDWHHKKFGVDCMHPQRDDAAARKADSPDIKAYAEYLHNQTRELLTQFGDIDLLWYDFSYPGKDGKGHKNWQSRKLVNMIRKLQPNVLLNNRLDLPDAPDFVTPEQYQPFTTPTDDKGRPLVWEACQTLSGSWGYHRDEMTWKSVPQLLTMLIDGVSKGGNLLLNVGPTGRGEIDYRAREALEGMGDWMHYNSRSIYGCGAAPKSMATPSDCRLTYNKSKKRVYVHVLNWPFRDIHMPKMAGKVEYAQFLHDASEVHYRESKSGKVGEHENMKVPVPEGTLTLELPVVKPRVEIPVIELFLK
jgi:alpha-L-fucosidase